MDQNVHNFISTINPDIDIGDRNLFWKLVNTLDSDGTDELVFVQYNPDVLTMKIKNHTVFDYFYEKVLHDRYHPTDAIKWQNTLLKVIQLVDCNKDREHLLSNKKYILRLQGTYRTLTDVFKHLVDQGFDLGDPEFLVYSIIARGELEKLKILSDLYVIEDYPGVLDVALRFGRNDIISYFKEILEIDLPYYGKIMDFENYVDNPRYIYYQEHIARDDTYRHKAIVGASEQDYIKSINLVLNNYQYAVTVHTIERWCELIRSKEFVWDRINPTDILPILIDELESPLPLTHDFGQFNELIFGQEWSNRAYLIKHCLTLQNKLEEAEHRRDQIETRYNHLQSKYDKVVRYINEKPRLGNGYRTRRDTH